MEQLQAQIIYNLTLTLLFFILDFLFLGNKKPLFCAIIKMRRLLQQQNRGVLFMSFTKNIVSHKSQKGKQNFLHDVNAIEKKTLLVIHQKKLRKEIAKQEQEKQIPIAEPTGEKLVDYSATGRKRKWDLHKQNNLRLVELYRQAIKINPSVISPKRLQDLADCANQLEYLQDAEGNKKLYKTYFCRVRLCPMCQWRRSLKLFSQVSKITDYINKNNQVRYLFITLTQKNCNGSELVQEINKINKSFSLLVDKTKCVQPASKFKKMLLGYIKSTEITYNPKTKTYHPHLHCIFAVQGEYFNKANYINKNTWRAIWADLLKIDYLPQVNVQAIKPARQQKAVAELAKYPAKVSSILNLPQTQAVQVVIDLTTLCYKRRFVAFGGIFKKTKALLKMQDVEAENADLVGAGNIKEFNYVARAIYKYNVKFGCYISS